MFTTVRENETVGDGRVEGAARNQVCVELDHDGETVKRWDLLNLSHRGRVSIIVHAAMD